MKTQIVTIHATNNVITYMPQVAYLNGHWQNLLADYCMSFNQAERIIKAYMKGCVRPISEFDNLRWNKIQGCWTT